MSLHSRWVDFPHARRHAAELAAVPAAAPARARRFAGSSAARRKSKLFAGAASAKTSASPAKVRSGCKHCETVCENCGEDADPKVCSKPKNFVWFDWMPGGAKIYTKTKLMKKIETVTVPELQMGRRRYVPPMRRQRRCRQARHDRLRRCRPKPRPRPPTRRNPSSVSFACPAS